MSHEEKTCRRPRRATDRTNELSPTRDPGEYPVDYLRRTRWMIAVCAIRKVARELSHPVGLGPALVYVAPLGDDIGDRDRIVLRRPRLASLHGSAKNIHRNRLVLDSIATQF